MTGKHKGAIISRFEGHVLDSMRTLCGVNPGQRVIVALSGGADSVALLASLLAAGYDCQAAHCNFHLRGEESQRDMRHVEALTESLGVDLSIKHFDVPEYMERTGVSVEMACRELRYAWFTELLERTRAAGIAVAHHSDDQVETFTLNLLRGTGIAGLTGMDSRNGLVLRPMLGLSRRDVEQYLKAKGLKYVTDSTNALNDFRRNRIRNIIVPALRKNFDGASEAILSTMQHLRDQHALYRWAVAELGRPYTDNGGAQVDVAAMRRAVPEGVCRTLLYEMLKPRGFNITQVDNMLHCGREATVYTTDTCVGELSRGKLRLQARSGLREQTDETEVSLRWPLLTPAPITVERLHVSAFRPEKNPRVMYLDEIALEPEGEGAEATPPRFTVRHWQRGDRLRPYGMKGEKLVSDLFTDAKLSPEEKRSVWLLTRNGRILWVAGIRASSFFAITPRTRFFLKLTLRQLTTQG